MSGLYKVGNVPCVPASVWHAEPHLSGSCDSPFHTLFHGLNLECSFKAQLYAGLNPYSSRDLIIFKKDSTSEQCTKLRRDTVNLDGAGSHPGEAASWICMLSALLVITLNQYHSTISLRKSTMTDLITTENEKKEWGSPLPSISTLALEDDPEQVNSSGFVRCIHVSMANCQTGTSNMLCRKDGIWQFRKPSENYRRATTRRSDRSHLQRLSFMIFSADKRRCQRMPGHLASSMSKFCQHHDTTSKPVSDR